MAKVTEDQMNEALNPGLSKTIILIGDEENQKSIKIKIMSARKEPIFIRDLKNIAVSATGSVDTSKLTIQNLIPLLDNVPTDKIAVLAAQVTFNSGEFESDTDWLLDNCSTAQLIELVTTQINKQGYLDFLLRMMAKLSLGKVV
ncbi:hypothetical protein [Pelosinus sp. sgz500959]|uniref:hypothetical protein n=1 Tax=Pelosinus sp. sgz500959 TaxID=3242472 RepID=UPI003671AAFC